MPKTAVYEYYRAVFGKLDVWLSRQLSAVLPVAESAGKQRLPHQHFWLCILASDTSHHATPLLGRDCVHIVQYHPAGVSSRVG